jgi:hypothetical protein
MKIIEKASICALIIVFGAALIDAQEPTSTRIGAVRPDMGDLGEAMSNIVDVVARQYVTWSGKVALRTCGNTEPGFQFSYGVNTFADLTNRLMKSGIKSNDIQFLWQKRGCSQRLGEWEVWYIPPTAQFPPFELSWSLESIHYTVVIEDGFWSKSPKPFGINKQIWGDLLLDLARQMRDQPRSFAFFGTAACYPPSCNKARAKINTAIRQLAASGIASYRLKIMPAVAASKRTLAVHNSLFPDITLVELNQ